MSRESTNGNADFNSIARRLDALIRPMLESQRKVDEEPTIGDQLLLLEDAGLSPSEAGRILGIESRQLPAYVRKAKNKKLKLKAEKKREEKST